MKKAKLKRIYADLDREHREREEELAEARDTNNLLVGQLSESRAIATRLTADVVRLRQQHAVWVEIVAKDGQVVRAGLGAQVSRDAIDLGQDEWDIRIFTQYSYETTVQFLDDGETYKLKTEKGERLLVRKEIRP